MKIRHISAFLMLVLLLALFVGAPLSAQTCSEVGATFDDDYCGFLDDLIFDDDLHNFPGIDVRLYEDDLTEDLFTLRIGFDPAEVGGAIWNDDNGTNFTWTLMFKKIMTQALHSPNIIPFIPGNSKLMHRCRKMNRTMPAISL